VADDRAVMDFIQAVPNLEFTSAWLIRLQNIDQRPDLYSIVQQYREYFRDMKAINEKIKNSLKIRQYIEQIKLESKSKANQNHMKSSFPINKP